MRKTKNPVSYQEMIKNQTLKKYTEKEEEAAEQFIKQDFETEQDENKAICLECKKEFEQERDIQLCNKCVKLFNLEKLWNEHDNNQINALDFNESEQMREKYRK